MVMNVDVTIFFIGNGTTCLLPDVFGIINIYKKYDKQMNIYLLMVIKIIGLMDNICVRV